MKLTVLRLVSSIIAVAVLSLVAFGQSSSSSLSGVVADPTGAVIAGASVTVKNNDLGTEFKAVTASNGTFTVPALIAGTYTVTVSMPGFKQTIVNEVKLDAGVPGTVKVNLEVGGATESVVIQGGGEVLQTQSANISTTLQVKQIAQLPLQTRNAMDFLVFLPGVNTPAGARASTINGLPQSTINITIDGINTQDNFNKTGDGFFSFISPRLDAIEEVTISTATPGAESGGQGAIQIKFITRGGNNEYHGSLYEYHRNPWLNSNYWFDNRNVAPYDAQAAKTCVNGTNTVTGAPGPTTVALTATQKLYDPETCKSPRSKVLLNQFGGRIGGPITLPKRLFGPLAFNGKDRAFFFVNFEEFRQPTEISRTRTILNPITQTGVFQYNVTSGGVTTVRTKDLLQLAAANGQTATIDPTIAKLLTDIRNSTANTGGIQQLTDPNLQNFTFVNGSSGNRYYPTTRLDFNLTSKHHLENVYTYHRYVNTIDTLNNADPAFPGFPNHGGQYSHRFSESLTLRSTLTPTVVNEARFGFTGGTVLFFPDANAGNFTGSLANQGGFSLGFNAGITSPSVVTAPSRRNAPVWDISDTVTWTRGAHSYSFGGQFTKVTFWAVNQTVVPSIGFSVNANDPASALFNATNGPVNFPGADSATITRASNLYATLTGRVTNINANIRLNEKTGKYEYLGAGIQRGGQNELGVFGQDTWRVRPNLTLNYGLRWELQLPFKAFNGLYSTTTIPDLFGRSGNGNLFKPGTLTGNDTQFIQFQDGNRGYNIDYKNFAPSVGFAWSINAKNGWLKRILGDGGQTVMRGGYSIAYNRQGEASFSGVLGTNPGVAITTNRNTTIGNLVGGSLGSFPLLLRETSRLGPPAFQTTPAYPFTGQVTDNASIFDPGIRVPYTQSWSLGIQREISKDMAFESRYVHTLNLQQWTAYDLNGNDNNVLENGFLNEFKLAQANLTANIAAGRGNTFRYFGANTGTSPLPITLGYFGGAPGGVKPDPNNANSYTSAVIGTTAANLFTSTTFVNPLQARNLNPIGFAGSLYSDATRKANGLAAGFAANFFQTNPNLNSVSFTGNGGFSRYDGLQVELRRRLSKGLLVQANYTFAKAFNGSRLTEFRSPRVATRGGTLDHAFKVNWIYELPLGKGKMLFGNTSGLMDRLIGGWEFQGSARIQSGGLMNFGQVQLVGMTRQELQGVLGLYFDDANRIIYGLPKDIIDNTIKAFSLSATSATGYSGEAPTGRYLAPQGNNGCISILGNECAPVELIVRGQMFTRFDMSLLKRVKLNERFNFELRAEFLNALNNINFNGTTCASNSATCGQIGSSYRDVNNSQDPGGRLGQIVLRLNF